MLEPMGLAGRWQKAGSVEVCVQNSGPVEASSQLPTLKTTTFAGFFAYTQEKGVKFVVAIVTLPVRYS